VRPEHYVATMEAIRARGVQLHKSNVVVEEDLAEHVADLIRRAHFGARPVKSEVVPTGYPVRFEVERTFINIRVPSSLVSSSCARAKTANTA